MTRPRSQYTCGVDDWGKGGVPSSTNPSYVQRDDGTYYVPPTTPKGVTPNKDRMDEFIKKSEMTPLEKMQYEWDKVKDD